MLRPRVLLADDHEEFLKAEIVLLQPHFEVVGTARDGVCLVAEVARLNPDVVVVDVTMPVMNGIDAVHKLKAAGSQVKVVFLTINNGEEFVNACLAEGARGFVWKSRMKAHLIPAIYAVLGDQPYISPLTHS